MDPTGWEMRPTGWIVLVVLAVLLAYLTMGWLERRSKKTLRDI